MPLPAFKVDPRILADLRRQRASIVKGLICVLLTSLLTAATITLTERGISAIEAAAPVVVDIQMEVPGARELAEELGLPKERVSEAIQKIEANGGVQESQVVRAKRQDEALQRLGIICLLVVVVYGLKYFLTRGQTYYLSRAANRLASDLRQKLFDKLQRLPVSYFGDKKGGGIQSVLNNDVGVYQNAVNMIRDSIDGPIKAILALVQIFFIQWQLALVALVFVPILAFLVHRNGQKMKVAQAKVQDEIADMAAMSSESLGGIRVIKAFSAEAKISDIYRQLVEKQFKSQMKAVWRFAQLRPMVEVMGAVSLAIILYICGWLSRAGTLEISQVVALAFALDIINQGARSMAGVNNTYNQVQAAADRIHREVLDVEEEHFDNPAARAIGHPVGRIEFKDVCFDYPDGTHALRHLSFTIEPGQSLALVGPSGAGKSTIADLMLRFYDPTSGQITFDGVDYRDLRIDWLREQFSVVPQTTFLFAGTIAENLRLGNSDASEEDLEQAARAANAMQFLEEGKEGLASIVGERGNRLSGGEGQRLAIARALVRKPKVMVLDEATSNLDAHSEKVVTEALEMAMKDRTTLFIAHRLTTAARASRIIMLRHGEILEQGTHEDLLARDGAYAAMYKAFTSGLVGDL